MDILNYTNRIINKYLINDCYVLHISCMKTSNMTYYNTSDMTFTNKLFPDSIYYHSQCLHVKPLANVKSNI